MIIDNVKAEIKNAMKNKDTATLGFLRLVVGTVQQDGKEDDKTVEAIIRKMIKNNNQTIDTIKDDESKKDDRLALEHENDFLNDFLPQTMSGDDIREYISDKGIDVTSLPNQGAAMGAVMKALKADGKVAQGGDVKAVVESLLS